jgi:hypothetical protein
LLLANVFQNQTDVSRYWVSEKLDGARAFWDGKSLWFRSGQAVHAPAWFTAGFPPRPLDGELWLGRGGFDRLSGIVRKQQAVDEEWRQVRYMVFELPEAPGTFSERIEAMGALVRTSAVPWLQAVEQFRVADRAELMRRMNEVVRAGGEGLMLHLADAPYVTGRGDVLLKVKPWLDAEATPSSAMCRDRASTGACWVRCGWRCRMAVASGSAPVSRMKLAARRRPSAHVDHLPLSRTEQERPAPLRQLSAHARGVLMIRFWDGTAGRRSDVSGCPARHRAKPTPAG